MGHMGDIFFYCSVLSLFPSDFVLFFNMVKLIPILLIEIVVNKLIMTMVGPWGIMLTKKPFPNLELRVLMSYINYIAKDDMMRGGGGRKT